MEWSGAAGFIRTTVVEVQGTVLRFRVSPPLRIDVGGGRRDLWISITWSSRAGLGAAALSRAAAVLVETGVDRVPCFEARVSRPHLHHVAGDRAIDLVDAHLVVSAI